MAEPRILDSKGNPLAVGDRVLVDGCDESHIVGYDLGYNGSLRRRALLAHRLSPRRAESV